MFLTHWFRPPRHLLVIFLVIVLLPSTLLVVSGWQLMRQEETRATEERQAQLADVVVAELRQRIAGIDLRLREDEGEFTPASARDDFVFAVFGGDTTVTRPAHRLLFYPVTTAAARELPAAALTHVHDLRRRGEVDAALAAWARVAGTREATVNGLPADLFARWAEGDLLDAAGRSRELKERAEALYADLHAGTWQLDRRTFETQVELVSLWLDAPSPPASAATARTLSSAVARIWERWRGSAGAIETSGHESLAFDGHQAAVFWRADAARLAVFVATATFVEDEWMPALRESGRRQNLRISLRDPGAAAASVKEARQVASETRLPWTVAVTSIGAADSRLASGRFRFWLAGVALLSLIVVGGAFVIARAAARELAVARLQTDFVAAVSHEFRTPLTSLRQIGEVLHDGRVHSNERRQTYYAALMRQTERLHHLVETLLDFGRMEAGRSPYRREPMNLASWARSVVDQFNREIEARSYTVELASPDEPIPVLADAQALTNALWNLLDNAVKYSPACKSVWVTVERSGDTAAVRVRDQGIGVSVAEQRSIFGKFVRGDDAKRQNIPGTGIGLAMVQHIMKAHGGSVRVESAPGVGSTFTLILPCHAS